MLQEILISLHALFAAASFIFGWLAINPTVSSRDWTFRIYYFALHGAVIAVAAAVAYDWHQLDTTTRLTFTALISLGTYMLWRAHRAHAGLKTQSTGWQEHYIDDIGFTLISLFDGFGIVAAIDLKASAPIVGAVAVLGIVAGLWAIASIKKQLPRPH